MSRPAVRWRVGFLAAVLLAVPAARAEVSATGDEDPGADILLMGITEGPDPMGPLLWQPIRDEGDSDEMLNPDGAARLDGRPTIEFVAGVARPLVAWAFNVGTDHDIAFSEWNGESWDETEFLTATTADEVDPRLQVDAQGNAHLVWWETGPVERIWVTSRPAGKESWNPAIAVIEDGRRPTVASDGVAVCIAFERHAPAGGQELVLATDQGDGSFALQIVARTSRNEALDSLLHVEGGRIWLDWKNSETTLAYSVRGEEGWSPPVSVPWTDGTWVGEEIARRLVRSAVLHP
jgi:hypothetical protein